MAWKARTAIPPMLTQKVGVLIEGEYNPMMSKVLSASQYSNVIKDTPFEHLQIFISTAIVFIGGLQLLFSLSIFVIPAISMLTQSDAALEVVEILSNDVPKGKC